MAHISITVKPEWEVNVKTGDELEFTTSIAHISHQLPQKHVIPIAQVLKFKPANVFRHLKKNIGDKIYKGDVIAVKDSVFSTQKFIADADGLLTEVNHLTGEITMQEEIPTPTALTVQSFIKGVVGAITNQEIQCKVSKTLSTTITNEIPNRFGGPLVITDNTQAILLTLPQVQGNIILTQECTEYVISKLEALGALCVISTKTMGFSHTSLLVVEKENDLQAIIDFAPTAVYANAAGKTITFYK